MNREKLKELFDQYVEMYDLGILGCYNLGSEIQLNEDLFFQIIKNNDFTLFKMKSGLEKYPVKLSFKLEKYEIFTILRVEEYQKWKEELGHELI